MNSSDPCPRCEWAARQLFELRDGRLDGDEAAALRAHLDACPHCREDHAWDDRLRDLFRAMPLPTPRAGLAEQVRCRLLRARRLRWAGMGVAAAALLTAGLVAWQNGPRAPETPVAVRPVPPPPLSASNDLPGAPVLFAAPPVDSLDVLARQQAAYVAVLMQLGKE